MRTNRRFSVFNLQFSVSLQFLLIGSNKLLDDLFLFKEKEFRIIDKR